MTPGKRGLAVALQQELLVYSWMTQHLQAGCISTVTSIGKRVNSILFPVESVVLMHPVCRCCVAQRYVGGFAPGLLADLFCQCSLCCIHNPASKLFAYIRQHHLIGPQVGTVRMGMFISNPALPNAITDTDPKCRSASTHCVMGPHSNTQSNQSPLWPPLFCCTNFFPEECMHE